MKVVILCGGLGTRLREETEFRPKPMVNIGSRPILWHIMKVYASYGHKDFILSLGYKGQMIKEYFYHYELSNTAVTISLGNRGIKKLSVHQPYDEIGWNITMIDTGDKALKGARLKRAEKYINDELFMVSYGDTIANIDLNELLVFHRRHKKIATVTGINPASRFGELKTRGDKVESFVEKPDASLGLINGGFFVFNRKIFDYLSNKDNCDLEVGTLERIAHKGELMVYKHNGFWACMDTIRDMEYLNELWAQNKAKWKVW